MPKPDTGELCIVIRSSSANYCKRITADVCEIRDGELRCHGSCNQLRTVVCSTYVGHDFPSNRPDNELWGWEIRAENIATAGARELAALAKTLSAIDRKMLRYREREGNPESFGQYVNRFARAVGATKVCSVNLRNKRSGYMEIKNAAYLVDSLRREDFPTAAELADAAEKAGAA